MHFDKGNVIASAIPTTLCVLLVMHLASAKAAELAASGASNAIIAKPSTAQIAKLGAAYSALALKGLPLSFFGKTKKQLKSEFPPDDSDVEAREWSEDCTRLSLSGCFTSSTWNLVFDSARRVFRVGHHYRSCSKEWDEPALSKNQIILAYIQAATRQIKSAIDPNNNSPTDATKKLVIAYARRGTCYLLLGKKQLAYHDIAEAEALKTHLVPDDYPDIDEIWHISDR